MNGDGYADVIVGAPRLRRGRDGRGRGLRVSGERLGDRRRRSRHGRTPSSSRTRRTRALGTSVAGAGDVNGDGYADVIVGACRYDAGETRRGRGLRVPRERVGASPTAIPGTRPCPARVGSGGRAPGLERGGSRGRERRRLRRRDRRAPPATTRARRDEGAAFVFLGSAAGIADGDPGDGRSPARVGPGERAPGLQRGGSRGRERRRLRRRDRGRLVLRRGRGGRGRGLRVPRERRGDRRRRSRRRPMPSSSRTRRARTWATAWREPGT